jgi:nickel transport system ATP-binding protein
MYLLELKNVTKSYPVKRMGASYNLMAVHDVSFSVKAGQCVGLVGESGCGKSTLARLITGLERPTSGKVLFEGTVVNESNGAGKKKKRGFIRWMQMVFQNSYDAVDSRYPAQKIIAEPLSNYFRLSARETDIEISKLLAQVGIADDEREKYAHQFSGGQLQRICIARALASKPKLLVLDEPLSSLDVSVQAQILNLLFDLKKELGISYILISHDLEVVYYLSDVIIIMYGGRIMEQINDIKYFNSMIHPYTIRLLSSTQAYRKKYENSNGAKLEGISINLGVQKEGYQGCPYCERCSISTEICNTKCPDAKEVEPGHFVACHSIG